MFSIIVVTQNNLPVVKEVIEHIIESTDMPAELIVVDSASTDKTESYLRKTVATFNPRHDGINHMLVHVLDHDSIIDSIAWGLDKAGSSYVYVHIIREPKETE